MLSRRIDADELDAISDCLTRGFASRFAVGGFASDWPRGDVKSPTRRVPELPNKLSPLPAPSPAPFLLHCQREKLAAVAVGWPRGAAPPSPTHPSSRSPAAGTAERRPRDPLRLDSEKGVLHCNHPPCDTSLVLVPPHISPVLQKSAFGGGASPVLDFAGAAGTAPGGGRLSRIVAGALPASEGSTPSTIRSPKSACSVGRLVMLSIATRTCSRRRE